MSWTVRINGNPTIKCRDERTGLAAYQGAQRYQATGHSVELYFSSRRVLPAADNIRR